MKIKVSSKHLQIDKAQSKIVVAVTAATVVTVFCLMSSKALLGQAAYQRKVISETNKTTQQLLDNKKNADKLVNYYEDVFIGKSSTNIIGGRNTDKDDAVPPDGTNARIVLDALPTTYDFPALVTSLSALLRDANLSSPNISGTDQSTELSSAPSATPQVVTVTVNVSGTGNYSQVQKLITDLERSIRPFDITNLSLSGGENNLSLTAIVNTYYQPAKSMDIGKKEIR